MSTTQHHNGQNLLDELANHPDVFERIKYLIPNEMPHEQHIVARDGDKIIGICGTQPSPYDNTVLWVKFVSVDPEHQNQGVATLLLKDLFQRFDGSNLTLEMSTYTKQGEERIKHIVARLKNKHPNLSVLG